MCLILFAYQTHPRYRLLLAANRDEFYARPTVPAAFWHEAPEVLAGRDLQGGGTWLGVTRQGRFAAITNYRNPSDFRSDAPSRGELISQFLRGKESPQAYLDVVARHGQDYNGFNVLVGDSTALWYYSNQSGSPRRLEPGIHGLSNHLLNTSWPKVEWGRRKLGELLAADEEPTTVDLFELLANRTRAADSDLPNTGVSLEWERKLSSFFIESPGYGTRSSTLVRITSAGELSLTEKTWPEGTVREFQVLTQQD
ncbi:MAG: NRDE family protein [Candidatus Competibacteraceae bacterium]|nr:NRDE family protein [Candidatus Competibacteraceae bacterium]